MYTKTVSCSAANLVALATFAKSGKLFGISSKGITLREQKSIVEEITGQSISGDTPISIFRKQAQTTIAWLRALAIPEVDCILKKRGQGTVNHIVQFTC